MATDVRVPTTGNAGEDAVIADVHVTVGETVAAGDVLVVLETAKSTLDVEAPVSGEVLQVLYVLGDEVPEHEVLVILGEPGEKVSETGPAMARDDMGGTAPAQPSSGLAVKDDPEPVSSTEPTSASAAPSTAAPRRLSVSPRARRLAEQRGVDLAQLGGTGPNGRILVRDIPTAAPTRPPAPALPAAAGSPTADSRVDEFEVVPVRGARKVTAQRMHSSLQDTAQVTLTRYADGDALLSYASRLRAHADERGLPRVGVNDLVLYAVARALADHPEVNSWFDWDGIRRFRSVHLGFAVDTGDALLVPVIRNASDLTLGGIARAAREAVDRARSGRLTSAEMDGGTFTVSNLGGLGVHWFTPVLNPPQTAILGVGAAYRAFPNAPEQLPLSLTFDHRAVDGAAAARCLAAIADALASVDLLPAS